MRNKDELKNVLNDESLEQVVGGVDDGSPDNTWEILDEYVKKDKWVKVISNGAILEPGEPESPKQVLPAAVPISMFPRAAH